MSIGERNSREIKQRRWEIRQAGALKFTADRAVGSGDEKKAGMAMVQLQDSGHQQGSLVVQRLQDSADLLVELQGEITGGGLGGGAPGVGKGRIDEVNVIPAGIHQQIDQERPRFR